MMERHEMEEMEPRGNMRMVGFMAMIAVMVVVVIIVVVVLPALFPPPPS